MDKIMFNEYLDKAMQHAHYEQIEDGTYLAGFLASRVSGQTHRLNSNAARNCVRFWKAGYSSTLLITHPYPLSMG